MGVKTDHADLLNALDVMQRSPVYVLRRSVLREAELLIARQEREIAELRKVFASAVGSVLMYADDGEMHDTSERPWIDFRRDSADDIHRKLVERAAARIPRALAPRDLTEAEITDACFGIMLSEHGAIAYALAIADAVLRAAGVRK